MTVDTARMVWLGPLNILNSNRRIIYYTKRSLFQLGYIIGKVWVTEIIISTDHLVYKYTLV